MINPAPFSPNFLPNKPAVIELTSGKNNINKYIIQLNFYLGSAKLSLGFPVPPKGGEKADFSPFGEIAKRSEAHLRSAKPT